MGSEVVFIPQSDMTLSNGIEETTNRELDLSSGKQTPDIAPHEAMLTIRIVTKVPVNNKNRT
jgi:hypothetical protein